MHNPNAPVEVELFVPCFIDQIYPETAFNMVKVLESLGCKVFYNPNQSCCGQPAYNAGFFKQCEPVALKWMEDLGRVPNRYIVGPTASCVGMVRGSYETVFEDSIHVGRVQQLKPRVFEFTEFLIDVLKVEAVPGAKLEAVATYHDSCSALRECGIKEGPRKLLANVAGLTLVEMEEAETCCGFGGTFAVKFEPISVGMAAQKTDNAVATQASVMISTDSSCLLHLQTYINKQQSPIRTMHIADVLASGW